MLGVTCVLRVICSTTNFDSNGNDRALLSLQALSQLSLSVSLSIPVCRGARGCGCVRPPCGDEPCAAVPRSLENLAPRSAHCRVLKHSTCNILPKHKITDIYASGLNASK